MQRSVRFQFRSSSTVTDITGNIPRWCKNSLPFASAERTVVREGTVVSQFYSHFLFFIELLEIELHSEIVVDFFIDQTSLFLFMMMQGKIEFQIPDREPKMVVHGDTCYATYNHVGSFSFSLPKGRHRLCYIMPRTEWLAKNINIYPRLEQFMEIMKNGTSLYGHLPSCEISMGMDLGIQKLFSRYERKDEDLEAVLMRDVKRIMFHYQTLLDAKLTQRPLLIKEYIDKNYDKPEMNNALLMKKFHIIEKTLITMFKTKFGTTPYSYLVDLRMEKAKLLLERKEKTPTEVSVLVGYDNFRSFSARFKETFGTSPSTYGNHTSNFSVNQSQ